MSIFNKKHNIRIIGEDWKIIKDKLKVKTIPRKDEYLIFKNTLPYYQVVNVIHTYYRCTTKALIVVKEVESSEKVKLF